MASQEQKWQRVSLSAAIAGLLASLVVGIVSAVVGPDAQPPSQGSRVATTVPVDRANVDRLATEVELCERSLMRW